jgi:hypothetical protein
MSEAGLFDAEAIAPVVTPKVTERQMLNALHERYSAVSQGGSIRYAVAEFVRNAAGLQATRTADFMAMDLWPDYGKGLHLHGFEVKCSRSDWLSELKNPWKAQAFLPYVNRWWLVVSDARIVKDGELPEGWGLLVLTTRGLRAKVAAPARECEPLPRTMIAALLRAIQVTATRRAALGQEGECQWEV